MTKLQNNNEFTINNIVFRIPNGIFYHNLKINTLIMYHFNKFFNQIDCIEFRPHNKKTKAIYIKKKTKKNQYIIKSTHIFSTRSKSKIHFFRGVHLSF